MKFFSRSKRADSSHSSQQCLTLNQFFDQHYFPHAKVTKAQHKHDWSIYNTHMRLDFGDYLLSDLKTVLLDVWVREQIVAGYKRSTINKHIYLMNRLLNLARSWGHIVFDRDQQPIRRLTFGDHKQRFLSSSEIEAVLKQCQRSTHPYLYMFIKLLLLTGARKGEALRVRWCDIDFDKRIWIVPRSKNSRSRRIVLNDVAVETVLAAGSVAERFGLIVGGDAYVFQNPRTQSCYQSFYAAWYIARDAAGLADVRIHDLRHTFASLLVNRGVSLYEVQTLLGHSSIQMTQRYAHLAPNLLHSRAQLVGDIVGGKSI
jgi:integrase